EHKRAAKVAKSTIKALRRQSLGVASQAVTRNFVDTISDAIHGSLKDLPSMTPEQVKSARIGNVKLFQKLQQQLQKAAPISPSKGTRRRGDDVRDDLSVSSKLELAYVQGIFAKFGVRPFADGS